MRDRAAAGQVRLRTLRAQHHRLDEHLKRLELRKAQAARAAELFEAPGDAALPEMGELEASRNRSGWINWWRR